eukprot:gene17227-20495_t
MEVPMADNERGAWPAASIFLDPDSDTRDAELSGRRHLLQQGVFMTKVSGACSTTSGGVCIQSPNYPAKYNAHDDCQFSVSGEGILRVMSFNTEQNYDKFYVGSDAYSGNYDQSPRGNVRVNSATTLRFTSDHSKQESGFKICIDSPGVCPHTENAISS